MYEEYEEREREKGEEKKKKWAYGKFRRFIVFGIKSHSNYGTKNAECLCAEKKTGGRSGYDYPISKMRLDTMRKKNGNIQFKNMKKKNTRKHTQHFYTQYKS